MTTGYMNVRLRKRPKGRFLLMSEQRRLPGKGRGMSVKVNVLAPRGCLFHGRGPVTSKTRLALKTVPCAAQGTSNATEVSLEAHLRPGARPRLALSKQFMLNIALHSYMATASVTRVMLRAHV